MTLPGGGAPTTTAGAISTVGTFDANNLPVELDATGAGVLSEQVGGALYEWREQTAAVRVAGEPKERLAAVLAMASGLREARRSAEAAPAG